MAKKKESAAVTAGQEAAVTDPVELVCAQIEKAYGEGVAASARGYLDEKKTVIPFGPCLDLITGGGVEEGSWVGITGNPKSYKSSTALSFCANAQRPEYGSRPVFYAKVEGRLSAALLQGTRGLVLDRPQFTLIQSSRGRILSAQEYLSILSEILRQVPRAVVVIDSISALCEERELTGGVGTETRGGGAKLFSSFCRQMANVVPVNQSVVIGITHLIANTSGLGAPLMERAARAWQYQCDYQLRVKNKSPWARSSDARILGAEVSWVCNTSRRGTPGMAISSYVRYGTGIDRLYELAYLGDTVGLIKKKGSWYTLSYLEKHLAAAEGQQGEPPKAQGLENVARLLGENPEWAAWLDRELASASGGAGAPQTAAGAADVGAGE